MSYIKTAVSIKEDIYKRAEKIADEMNISRSQLFTTALEKYLREIENKKLLDKINEVYKVADPEENEYMGKVKKYRHRKTESEE